MTDFVQGASPGGVASNVDIVEPVDVAGYVYVDMGAWSAGPLPVSQSGSWSVAVSNPLPTVDTAGEALVYDPRLLTRKDEALVLLLETNGLSETEYIGPLSNREVV